MSRLAVFERIHVINLASRIDRYAQMAEQLASIGLSFDAPEVSLFPAVRPADAGGFPTVGARGCFLSHLEVLRQSVGLRSVLIMEDDLNLVDGFEMPALDTDWGIFYGGAQHRLQPSGVLTEAPPGEMLVCAHFIAFNGSVIPRVVRYLEAILTRAPGDPVGGPMHVDGAYNRFRQDNPDVRTFIATPELGYQRASRTDIHALRWFDRLPLVRSLVQLVRDVRQTTARNLPSKR
jgi:hypothetical protein